MQDLVHTACQVIDKVGPNIGGVCTGNLLGDILGVHDAMKLRKMTPIKSNSNIKTPYVLLNALLLSVHPPV